MIIFLNIKVGFFKIVEGGGQQPLLAPLWLHPWLASPKTHKHDRAGFLHIKVDTNFDTKLIGVPRR